MDLYSVTVTGFKRFSGRWTVRTTGKLVALVGPNEAGKSSLLSAIALLGNDKAPAPNDFSRSADKAHFLIEGRYFLSPDDIAAAGLDGPHWLTVRKEINGQRTLSLNPPPPRRNIGARAALYDAVEAAFTNKRLASSWSEEKNITIKTEWSELVGLLDSTHEDTEADDIESIKSVALRISAIAADRAAATARKIDATVIEYEEQESGLNPHEKAMRSVRERLPDIIVFSEESRNLKSEYDIDSLRTSYPEALHNLCDVANIDISDWIRAHDEDDTAEVTTIEHAANKHLTARFERDWKQSGISVSMRLQNGSISIQIVNEKSEFTSFAERSDGLRQFAALIAFAGGAWRDKPIMLIDEAEQRLHYDAQADLVQMLARQRVSSKVIFTTHSAGCLPEDLGNGVRLIRPQPDNPTRSEIVNKFWAENDPGLVPLLFGMGAGTLAFFPTRNAVVVEGPADMLLLPTIMKAALGSDVLGYQFVPGLSVTGRPFHAPALGGTSGVLYLVDSDPGGNDLRKQLLEAGVSNEDIIQVSGGGAVECEDLVNGDLLKDAANRLLEMHHRDAARFLKSDITTKNRMSELEKLFKKRTDNKLPKVELAYEILELIENDPNRPILDPRRADAARSIADRIRQRFEAHHPARRGE